MRATFDLIEAAAERGNVQANDALAVIRDTIRTAFSASTILGFKLDGSDPCERVALAVWLKESAPRAFADMTGTRYTVTGLDCSAEGMERLRDQSEFILIAYPAPDDTPESLCAEWLSDLDSVMREDGFDFEQAELAIRAYVADATESGYLPHKLAENKAILEGFSTPAAHARRYVAEEDESPAFRLYVRDNAPDAD
jgi:hypothetical protein